MLRAKSEVTTIFPIFYNLIQTQFNICIKSMRSDNAPELSFIDFFNKKSIQSFYSCVDRPQQNSVVERKHQHILNVACALMFQSHIPLVHWSDCILTSVYLINRTPSPFLGNKTCFELLMKKRPLYSHLKVFGCLCYGSTLPKTRSMFSPLVVPAVFLGYPPSYKGYKLLDLSTNASFISHDVIFHEHIFPFTSISHLTQFS